MENGRWDYQLNTEYPINVAAEEKWLVHGQRFKGDGTK